MSLKFAQFPNRALALRQWLTNSILGQKQSAEPPPNLHEMPIEILVPDVPEPILVEVNAFASESTASLLGKLKGATPVANKIGAEYIQTDIALIDGSTNPVSGNAVFDAIAAKNALATSFTPVGSIAATNVQAAIEELDADVTGLSADSAKIDPTMIPGMIAGYDVSQTVRSGNLIDTWIDISGNGRDASASGSKSPVYGTFPNEYADGTSADRYSLASPIPINPKSMTVVVIYGGRRVPATYVAHYSIAAQNNDSTLGFLAAAGSVQFYNPVRQIGVLFDTGGINSSVSVFGVSSTQYVTNGVTFTGAANNPATTSIANIWGYAGAGGFVWRQERIALFVYNRKLSAAQIKGIENFYGVKKATRAMHLIADSFGAGVGASIQQLGYPRLVELATGVSLVGGIAQSGAKTDSLAGLEPSVVSGLNSSVAAGLNPIVLYDLGKNDVAANVSLVTTKANITSLLTQIKATGAKVVVLTVAPRVDGFSNSQTSGGYETARNDLNAWIRTQTALWNVVADVAANPLVGPQAAASGAYYSDGLHLSDAGQAVYRDVIVAAINSL